MSIHDRRPVRRARRWGVLAIAAALLAQAGAAVAGGVVVTFTGTVQQGVDATGLFGAPGQDLTGDAFTSQYLFLNYRGQHTLFSGLAETQQGGAWFGLPTPLVSSSLTIAGVTATVQGDSLAALNVGRPAPALVLYSASADHTDSTIIYAPPNHVVFQPPFYIHDFLYNSADLSTLYPGTPPALFAPQSYAGLGGNSFGSFSFYGSPVFTGLYSPLDNSAETSLPAFVYSRGVLKDDTMTVSFVPEPGAWAMLITGLSLIGAAARRRSRAAASARC